MKNLLLVMLLVSASAVGQNVKTFNGPAETTLYLEGINNRGELIGAYFKEVDQQVIQSVTVDNVSSQLMNVASPQVLANGGYMWLSKLNDGGLVAGYASLPNFDVIGIVGQLGSVGVYKLPNSLS